MLGQTYEHRRGQIATYFDRTAVEAWARLTSDAPVSRIRETVRAGRDAMRATLLSWLPDDLTGTRLLDAGCGTGALAVEAARRGAEVVAIDLSPKLVELAAERVPADVASRIDFRSGDMLAAELGSFDHMVAMDSLIHYQTPDMLRALEAIAPRIGSSLLFTFAPRTPLLAAMHGAGKLFPRSDRSPAIVPVRGDRLRRDLGRLHGLRTARHHRIKSGFYISEAQELLR